MRRWEVVSEDALVLPHNNVTAAIQRHLPEVAVRRVSAVLLDARDVARLRATDAGALLLDGILRAVVRAEAVAA